jgi:hypothetical protein
MCCYVIPLTCCGPPVIFSRELFLINCGPNECISLDPCFGTPIKAAPCNLCDLKAFLCCGPPCYGAWSFPFIFGMKKAEAKQFTAHMKRAVDDYGRRHPELNGELAIFQDVGGELLTNATAVTATAIER